VATRIKAASGRRGARSIASGGGGGQSAGLGYRIAALRPLTRCADVVQDSQDSQDTKDQRDEMDERERDQRDEDEKETGGR